MQITYKGDYAMKTILALSLNYGTQLVTIPDLAKKADIPTKFLEQVLLDLKKGGFVESRRGKTGGYLLARDPSEIRLGDIVRFIDGPAYPIACSDNKYRGCGEINKCVFRKIWQNVAKATADIIDNVTFAQLVDDVRKCEKVLVYEI